MNHPRILRPLERALRFYAVLLLAIVLFQGLGLGMYLVNVWPGLRAAGPGGEPVSRGASLLLALAVVAGFARAVAWIAIYWKGARAFALLRNDGDQPEAENRLAPVLSMLTRLLVASFVLDLLFLPAYYLSDLVVPFSLTGWRLGAVETARILIPQAFGVAALILAFLTHQYGRLLEERSKMKSELELTI